MPASNPQSAGPASLVSADHSLSPMSTSGWQSPQTQSLLPVTRRAPPPTSSSPTTSLSAETPSGPSSAHSATSETDSASPPLRREKTEPCQLPPVRRIDKHGVVWYCTVFQNDTDSGWATAVSKQVRRRLENPPARRGGKKTKTSHTLAERIRILATDPWVESFHARCALCRACGQPFQLDGRKDFYGYAWTKHRERCPKIKKKRLQLKAGTEAQLKSFTAYYAEPSRKSTKRKANESDPRADALSGDETTGAKKPRTKKRGRPSSA
ncbi:unnamed protein product [Mycena citricolor]|uniref:Uncharacterized protein n=1 Tax=Mycena citricolor TaxID=2018698 RepID=A0AAD2JWY9_9AGAR|nr:unnamed protein product [Mycena citricolor]